MPIDPKRVTPAIYPESPFPDDPDFPRAADWLGAVVEGDKDAIILGVPLAKFSLSGARCDLFPAALRAVLWNFSTYLGTHDVELDDLMASDEGDLIFERLGKDRLLTRIRTTCEQLRDGPPVALIGGDNSITAPAMIGLVGAGGGLITFDAHHDLRDYQRDGVSNGSPVRMLLDDGVAGERIWQIGIQDFANSKSYAELAESSGITVIPAQEMLSRDIKEVVQEALQELSQTDGIYVDMDMDVLERALAPGAPASQPGGLTPEDLAEAAFLCGTDENVKGLDIVEVDPDRDVGGSTVRAGALIFLSYLAGVASRQIAEEDEDDLAL
jgi:formiminoglutamase